MMDDLGDIGDWIIPVISFASFLMWAWVVRMLLPLLSGGNASPVTFRMLITSTVLGVSLALALSSLIYPSAIDSTTSRFFVGVARVILLTGGLMSVRGLRQHRRQENR